MQKIKFWLVGLLALSLSVIANAQFAPGQVLTAAQLNSAFAAVLPIAGGTLTGPLTVPTLTVTTALNTAHAAITGGTITGLSAPLPVASGGTNAASASGAALDNITGFSATGFLSRTGAGAYSFTGSTGSGNVALATAPTIASPTITGSFTATGLVTTSALATQAANTVLANATSAAASPTALALPGCSTSSSALNYTSGTGIGCNSSINATTLASTAWAAPGAIGSTTPNTGAFTTLSTTGATTHNGNVSQTQPTAATSGANQSSPTHVFNANYWTGSASATDSWTMQNVLGTGANPTSTLNLSHTGTSGNGGVLVNGTTDTSWSTLFPLYTFASVAHGNNNALIGSVINDLANSTNALPIGNIGYGKIKSGSSGNQVFGLYGLGENYGTSGVAVAAEFTSRNYCGAPDTALPPNEAIGTGTCVANALQVTSGGSFTNSVGILVGQEAGSSVGFNTDVYLKPDYVQFGLYIDAPSSGNQTSAAVLNNGNGVNFVAKTTGSLTAGNAVLDVQDASANHRFVVTQIGDVKAHAWRSSGLSVPTASTCTGVGTGGTCAIEAGSNDGAGTIVVTGGSSASAGGGTIALTFASAVGATSSACFLQPATNWSANTSLFVTSQSTTSFQFNYLNGGGTGTALANGTVYRINYFCTGH